MKSLLRIILISILSMSSMSFTLNNANGFGLYKSKTVTYSTQSSNSFGNDEQNQRQSIGLDDHDVNSEVKEGGETSLKGNRWSKYAPDANLPTNEFRAQLRENMKADLERRRREDPKRGNQPAKSYLDNL